MALNRLPRRLQTLIEWIVAPEGSPVDVWRRRVLGAMLLGSSSFGLVAYLVGAGLAWQNGEIAGTVADTLVYAAVLVITFARGLPYTVRAGVTVALPALLGAFLLFQFGFDAPGFAWMLAFPLFAGVLLGVRAGIRALGIMALVLVVLGAFVHLGRLWWVATTPIAATMWWVNSSSTLMLAALLTLAIGYVFDGLGREAEAREAAVRESDRRERLASLGTLTGGIAHDFNNLLQPIVSDAEHARRLLDDRHDAVPLLDDILLSAHRARTLVRRILSFARPAAGEREVVDLGNLVQESARLLRAVLPANVQLVPDTHDHVLVLADAGELQQVLLNLVVNAAHAMPRGGEVRIAVHRDDDALLVVQDTGNGMTPDVLARAFEPFFTTKQPGHGTGLGLATVHTVVTAMGGSVRVESEPGVGTRIMVRLPLVARTATSGTTITRIAPDASASRGAHVAVVDDEPSVLLSTSRLLERLGYTVSTFDSPRGLLDAIDAMQPAAQLVLTDLSMPGTSGWELAAALHEKYPALPVIVMTGNLDLADETPSGGVPRRRAGVTAILSKPFTSAELRAALQRIL